MKTIVYSVLVHSCLLQMQLVFEDQLDPDKQYVSMDVNDPWYRAVRDKCNCRKLVTYAVADEMVNEGVAEPLWKSRKSKIEKVSTAVWMGQQPQVPRIDLSTEFDLERAFINGSQEYVNYIEEIHNMYIRNRQELIVPFREELLGEWPRPCRDPHSEEILPGRSLFPFPNDERTKF